MFALQVLLTPRAFGGHEKALFGWLADAWQMGDATAAAPSLRVAVPGARLLAAARGAGVPAAALQPLPEPCDRRAVLHCLARWPRRLPLLLAPGVPHAQAWLLGATLALGHRPWLYVPMAYTAAQMGYRAARTRDALLAPLLRAAAGFVTIDAYQAGLLRERWRVQQPTHVLPNQIRLDGAQPPARPVADPEGRLRVAFVGRFDVAMKGLDWLEAQLRAGVPGLAECRWWFQGEGAGAPRLQALARDLGPERVTVTPFAPLAAALARNDVLLLASRYEGHPLVALEATALGWPVVATHEARLAGLLPPASVYAFGDAAGLAAALGRLRLPTAREAAVAHARSRLPGLIDPPAYRSALRALLAAWPRAPGDSDTREPAA